jgi:hypothetical protein
VLLTKEQTTARATADPFGDDNQKGKNKDRDKAKAKNYCKSQTQNLEARKLVGGGHLEFE